MEASNKKVSPTTSQGMLTQYQQQRNLAYKLLRKFQMQTVSLDLDTLIGYSLLPVPHCLGTVDGFIPKTNKASMINL